MPIQIFGASGDNFLPATRHAGEEYKLGIGYVARALVLETL